MKHFCSWVVFFLLAAWGVNARAAFPFSFRKQEIKTDYSQTMWDRIMEDQSRSEMRRGMMEMSAAKYQDATNSFARAVVKNSKDPMTYLMLGASLYWAGKVDQAVSEYKEALSLEPNNPMAYQLLGIASGWKGNVEEAQQYFLQANELDSNKADTHMNLGSTYAVQRNWDKALEHFRRAVELAPREPLFHYQLGTLYEEMGRDLQAEESFKKALKLFSNYEDAQLSLGALYEKLERPQEALKYYKRAVKTKPGDFVARLRYALLLLQQGENVRAREVLEQSFAITRLKAEGLALNAVYRASGRSAASFQKQIQKFKQNLERISPSKPIHIEVTMALEPLKENTPSGGKTTTFEKAYQELRSQTGPATSAEGSQMFKRSFALQAGDEKLRQQQIDELIEGLERGVREASEKYQVSLSMQGRTPDYNAPNALTQNRTTTPKAVYDPRIVGNDMGLWVMGRSWLTFVEDAQEILQEYPNCPSDGLCDLLRGVGALAAGNGVEAARIFAHFSTQHPKDPLGWLGQGTAAVIEADDPQAKTHYQKALVVAPENKVAQKNLKVLED